MKELVKLQMQVSQTIDPGISLMELLEQLQWAVVVLVPDSSRNWRKNRSPAVAAARSTMMGIALLLGCHYTMSLHDAIGLCKQALLLLEGCV